MQYSTEQNSTVQYSRLQYFTLLTVFLSSFLLRTEYESNYLLNESKTPLAGYKINLECWLIKQLSVGPTSYDMDGWMDGWIRFQQPAQEDQVRSQDKKQAREDGDDDVVIAQGNQEKRIASKSQ